MKSARKLMALIVFGAFATSTLAGETNQLIVDFTGTNLYVEPPAGEGFLMLEGQDGWIQPIPFTGAETFGPGGIVNTHDPGLGGDPGFIELIGHEQTATRASVPAVTGDATWMAWFHGNGNIPDDPPSGPDDFARRGNSGLQLGLGDASGINAGADKDIDINTRNSINGRALAYRKGNTGNLFQMFGFLVHGRVPAAPPIPDEQFPPPDIW